MNPFEVPLLSDPALEAIASYCFEPGPSRWYRKPLKVWLSPLDVWLCGSQFRVLAERHEDWWATQRAMAKKEMVWTNEVEHNFVKNYVYQLQLAAFLRAQLEKLLEAYDRDPQCERLVAELVDVDVYMMRFAYHIMVESTSKIGLFYVRANRVFWHCCAMEFVRAVRAQSQALDSSLELVAVGAKHGSILGPLQRMEEFPLAYPLQLRLGPFSTPNCFYVGQVVDYCFSRVHFVVVRHWTCGHARFEVVPATRVWTSSWNWDRYLRRHGPRDFAQSCPKFVSGGPHALEQRLSRDLKRARFHRYERADMDV